MYILHFADIRTIKKNKLFYMITKLLARISKSSNLQTYRLFLIIFYGSSNFCYAQTNWCELTKILADPCLTDQQNKSDARFLTSEINSKPGMYLVDIETKEGNTATFKVMKY